LSSIPFINANALVGLLDAMAAQPPSARATIEAPMIALASAAVLAQTLSVS
jgi:hypothetical protein